MLNCKTKENNGIAGIISSIFDNTTISYKGNKKIEQIGNLFDEDTTNICSKSHLMASENIPEACLQNLRLSKLDGGLKRYKNKSGKEGDGGKLGVNGFGDDADGANGIPKWTVGGACLTTDEFGNQVEGKYNSDGECVANKIDPFAFCPQKITLNHTTWDLNVNYDFYEENGGIQRNKKKVYPIQSYVNDLIRIDNKYKIDCPAVYIL